MKNISVKVAGVGDATGIHDVTIAPGTTVRDIKKKLNLGGVVEGARIVERISIGVK